VWRFDILYIDTVCTCLCVSVMIKDRALMRILPTVQFQIIRSRVHQQSYIKFLPVVIALDDHPFVKLMLRNRTSLCTQNIRHHLLVNFKKVPLTSDDNEQLPSTMILRNVAIRHGKKA
jgi:hypothetical protein